jgi:hypothetical protein
VLLLGVVQLISDAYFSLAVLFYVLSAMLPAYKGEPLTRTYSTPSELRTTAWRFSSGFFQLKIGMQLIGVIFGVLFLVQGNWSAYVDEASITDMLSPIALLVLVFKSLTNFLLTAVLAADALLVLNLAMHLEEVKCGGRGGRIVRRERRENRWRERRENSVEGEEGE